MCVCVCESDKLAALDVSHVSAELSMGQHQVKSKVRQATEGKFSGHKGAVY